MIRVFRLLSCLSSLLIAQAAHALIYVGENFSPVSGTTNLSTPSAPATDQTTTTYDSRTTVAAHFSMGLLVGGVVNYAHASNTAFTGYSLDYGPAAGFAHGGLHLIASYLFGGKNFILGGGGGVEYSGGSGFQVDLGYGFPLFADVRLGVSLVYRNLQYGTYSDPGTPPTDLGTKARDAKLLPMIALVFDF